MYRIFKNTDLVTRASVNASATDSVLSFFRPIDSTKSVVDFNGIPELRWIKISGYRFTDANSINDVLKSFAEQTDYFVTVLNKTADRRVELFLGTDTSNLLPALLPDCAFSDASAPSGTYSNILAGDFESLIVDWDSFLRAQCVGSICFIGRKLDPALIQNQLSLFDNLQAVIEEQKEFTLNTGSLSMRKYNSRADEALSYLLAMKQRLTVKASSSVFECAMLTSDTSESVISFFRSGGDRTLCRPVESIGTFIPSGCFPVCVCPEFESYFPVYNNNCGFLLSSEEIGKLLPFPKDQHIGFNVVRPERNTSDYFQFDINPFSLKEEIKKIHLGKVIPTGETVKVDISDLTQHVLVTGSSGSGKTTTLFPIIKQCNDNGVKTLIFEPVKGEFQKLPNYGINSKVYSTGHSGISLCFNPMIPQDLIKIRDHISGLVEAITSQSDNESPIPEALTMLLTHCYEKAGFTTEDVYFSDSGRRIPTLTEVFEEIRPFFSTLKLYQGEVRTNIMSALTVRLNVIKSFSFLHGSSRLDIEKLLVQNSVIQFDELNQVNDICFFGNLVLQNINEYIRNTDYSDSLKHLIVIDEAHNFFRKVCGEIQNSRTLSSENLSNMISELRSYGVGFIIADQRPSALSGAVIANTKLKICHAFESGEDISELSQALGLSDYQTHLLHTLLPGEAVISLRGETSVLKVKIERQKENRIHRINMCTYCSIQSRCRYNELQNIIAGLPLDYYAGVFKRHIGNPDILRRYADEISSAAHFNNSHELLCVLGHIVERVEGNKYKEYINSNLKNIITGGQSHG